MYKGWLYASFVIFHFDPYKKNISKKIYLFQKVRPFFFVSEIDR